MNAAVWVRLIPVAMIWFLFLATPKHYASFSVEGLPFIGIPVYILFGIIYMREMFRAGVSLARQVYFLLSYFAILSASFSLVYWVYGFRPYFNIPITRLDAFYFMVGTFSTAGTGNIVATNELTRAVQCLQMILDLGFVLFAVALVVARFTAVSSGSNSPPSS
jgi:hypothetical protein